MTFGIKSFSATGEALVDSTNMGSNFLHTSADTTAAYQVPSDGFTTTNAITTPNVTTSIQYSSSTSPILTVPGAFNASTAQYNPPAKTNVYLFQGGTAFLTTSNNVLPLSCNVLSYGSRNVASGETYGFEAVGNNGKLIVDPNYRTYYVHPNSGSNRIRTGTAVSRPSYRYSRNAKDDLVVNLDIVFDEPLDNPPLIFITQSSAPIAFAGMVRNASGKYIGAGITTCSIWAAYTQADAGGFVASTATYSYFIVSEQPPLYGVTSSHGVKVLDSSGRTIFGSNFFVPNIYGELYPLPYAWAELTNPFTPQFQVAQRFTNTSNGTKTSNQGICINPFSEVTGITLHTVTIPFPPTLNGNINITGRYLRCTPTTWTLSGNWTAAQTGVVGISSNRVPADSWDFHIGSTSQIEVFYADYAR